jgi:HEAT repeat protein
MPYLADGLKNPYPSVRIAVAEAIGAAGDAGARELLLPLLEDRNQAVCVAAVNALAAVGSTEDAACVVSLLASDLDETRFAAARALQALGLFCVTDELSELAEAESAPVRAAVALALSLAPDTAEVPELAGTMLSLARDPDETVRAEIAPALGAISSPDAISALMALAYDEHHRVRLAAIRSLGPTGGGAAARVLRAACSDENPAVRVAAIRGLAAQLSADDIPLVIELLAAPDPGPVLTALRGLDTIDSDEVTHAIVRLIEHDSEDVREAALRSLQQASPRKACTLGAVVLTGDDPAWNVRLAAVETLGGCPCEREAEPIVDRALADTDPAVRRAAVRAVPRVFGTDGASVLANLLADPEVGSAAREALVHMGTEVAGPLASLLSDSTGVARRELASLLGAAPSAEGRDALERMLRDGNADDRWWAALGLASCGASDPRTLADMAARETDLTTAALLRALSGGDGE